MNDSRFIKLEKYNNNLDIETNKKFSNFNKEMLKQAQPDKCLLCGKKCTSFCNSHTIPQFILENSCSTGIFLSMSQALNSPNAHNGIGKNNAKIFRNICKECDRTYFTNYENPENYEHEPTQTMMAEIALKNILYYISKTNYQNSSFDNLRNNNTHTIIENEYITDLIDNSILSLGDYKVAMKNALKTLKGKKQGYYLIDYFTLDYITKLIIQCPISLITGFDNEIINNVYSKDPNQHINYLHLCVFPIKGKTHVFLFIDNGCKKYTKFYKKFKKLSLENKLKVLNFIIFKYTEDWLINSNIDKNLLNNKNLIEVMSSTTYTQPELLYNFSNINKKYNDFIQTLINDYSLNNIPDIPNFLL